VLDPGVADVGQRLEGALEVDGQLVAQGEQLDADLVAWTRCRPRPPELAGSSWASAGAASALEVPTTAAVAAAVRRKRRRVSRAISSRPAVSS
jgi:ABC-type Fe3+ transport system permease subunit